MFSPFCFSFFRSCALCCEVREPHLLNVLANLRNFAARVPYKYRGSIEKAICSLYDRLILLFLQLKPRLLCMMQALKTEGSVGSMHA